MREHWLEDARLKALADPVTGEANHVEAWEWIALADEVLALRAQWEQRKTLAEDIAAQNDVMRLAAEVDRLRMALQRIAMGIAGRRAGPTTPERTPAGVDKADWQLAKDALNA